MQFQIKRGKRDYLFDKNNNLLITPEEGCWYLTLDTVEVYVGVRNTDSQEIELKPLNQAEINLDEFDDRFESIEDRLDAIEANAGKREITFAEFSQFPTIGESNVLYIALDENQLYIFMDNEYVPIGGSSSGEIDIQVINGGDAQD